MEALDLRGNPLVGLAFGRGNWKTVLIDLTALKNLQTGNLPKSARGSHVPVLGTPLAAGAPPPAGRKGVIDLNNSADFAVSDDVMKRLPPNSRGGGVGSTMPALRVKKGRPGLESMFDSDGGSELPPTKSRAGQRGGGNSFDMFMQMSLNGSGGGGENNGKEHHDTSAADGENGDLKKLLMEQLEAGEKEKADNNNNEAPKDGNEAAAVTGDDQQPPEETKVEEEESDDDEQDEGDIEINYTRKEGVIVHDFGAVDDMNKAGIIKAKKDVIQQEVRVFLKRKKTKANFGGGGWKNKAYL